MRKATAASRGGCGPTSSDGWKSDVCKWWQWHNEKSDGDEWLQWPNEKSDGGEARWQWHNEKRRRRAAAPREEGKGREARAAYTAAGPPL